MVMMIPCIIWTDKWGRRPLLVLGAIVIGFLMFPKGGLFKRFGEPNLVLDQPYNAAWLRNYQSHLLVADPSQMSLPC
ncbi:hypothetical protein V1504DRAFT_459862 [Lipomyces starkeyi]